MIKRMDTEEVRNLYKAVLSLESEDECRAFFEDLCTINELLSLAQRFEVAGLLDAKVTYNDIAEKTSASTATISRVNRALNYGAGGYEAVLKKLKNKSTE